MLNVVKMAKRHKNAETPQLDSAAARLVKKTALAILPGVCTKKQVSLTQCRCFHNLN